MKPFTVTSPELADLLRDALDAYRFSDYHRPTKMESGQADALWQKLTNHMWPCPVCGNASPTIALRAVTTGSNGLALNAESTCFTCYHWGQRELGTRV